MTKEYKQSKEYWASVFKEGKCVKRRVECLISFSDNPSLYPRIAIILKDRSTLLYLQSSFYVDVKARRYDMRGNVISEVTTVNGYLINPDEKFYEHLRDKNSLEIGYSDLILNSYFSEPLSDGDKNTVTFSLVNINFSFTFGSVMHDDKGIHHDQKPYFGDFNIIDDAFISFSSKTRYSDIDVDILKRFSKEVLIIKYDRSKSTQRILESFVKSLLPYLSFLSRSNVGYNYVTQITGGSNVISQKFRVLSVKPKDPGFHFECDYAIERSHHKQFLHDAISTLVSGKKPELSSIYQYNDAISQPITQSSYVLLFMALEALIDGYVNTVRRAFNNYLMRTFPNRKGLRRKIYFKKVIKRNAKQFLNKYNFIVSVSNVNNSDLWPVYDQVSYLNLSRIRNKIVHEGKIRDRKNLWCAFCHLDWIYLRLFLFVTGWSGPNNLNSNALSRYIPYRDWQNMLINK